MADNSVTFIGNLTREPELRFAQSGIAVVNIGMAVNERRLVNGEWQDQDPLFINVTAFRELAENVAGSLHKGDRVVVTGKLQVRNFERQDGTKGTAVECLADEVAVSLRRATAEVSRTTRSGGEGGQSAPPPASQRTGGDSYYGDEEPF
jgi:single-strand DNA-binding protein